MTWILVRFALIGPAVGALGFVFMDQVLQLTSVATSTLAQTSSVSELPATVSILWLYSLLLAHLLGGIPALIAGAAFARVLSRRSQNLSVSFRTLVGAVLGMCSALAFGLLFTSGSALPSLFRWAAAGALGGACSGCAVGATLFAQLRRNASTASAA